MSLPHPEEQAILGVVRECFAARRHGDPDEIFSYPLLLYARLTSGLAGFLTPVLRSAEVRALSVEAVEGQWARCACNIVTVADYATARWEGRTVGRVTGPVVLRQTDEGWRIADFVVDYRRVLETLRFYVTDVHGFDGNLRVGARAVQLARTGTALAFEVENRTGSHAYVEQVTLLGKPRLGRFFPEKDFADLAGARHVEPARTERLVAIWPLRKLLNTPTLEVDVRVDVAGAERPARLHFTLAFAGTPEPSYDEIQIRC